MKIAQLTPGSGDNFYCENCLRDGALVRAMRKDGHDVTLVPMYLPIQNIATADLGKTPIFFGGVNVYLQQKTRFFRHTPRWIDRWLDSPSLLKKVGKKAGTTNAKLLGDMTVSMLKGKSGRQAKELDRLIRWLAKPDNRPDLVCLSNILLAGLAEPIREKLGVPVVCLLQDEDGFLDSLPEPFQSKSWSILSERSKRLDAFIAVSEYYAGKIRDRLQLHDSRVEVVYTGIELEGYEPTPNPPARPTLGFLSQMCDAKGLDILADAFVILRKDDRLKNLKLRVAGGSSQADEAFLERVRRELRCWNLLDDVEFIDKFDKETRIEFLQSLSVLSVPEKQPVAYGLYVLEALACGVPVVQPWHGVFGELLEFTGGGTLYRPNNSASLAEALKPLLLEPEKARELGGWGRDAILGRFSIERTVRDLARLYNDVVLEFDMARKTRGANDVG
ncbi:MAG: glycosyltransferase family 4 protein [Sedimentisphaerales bacterium]|nr:glycosyltransferase family 4 protein [Sedimentisphaerales bacterium]